MANENRLWQHRHVRGHVTHHVTILGERGSHSQDGKVVELVILLGEREGKKRWNENWNYGICENVKTSTPLKSNPTHRHIFFFSLSIIHYYNPREGSRSRLEYPSKPNYALPSSLILILIINLNAPSRRFLPSKSKSSFHLLLSFSQSKHKQQTTPSLLFPSLCFHSSHLYDNVTLSITEFFQEQQRPSR